MPKKIGWKEITKYDLQRMQKDVNRHEQILGEILSLLENLSEEIQKMKEAHKQKVKSKKREG